MSWTGTTTTLAVGILAAIGLGLIAWAVVSARRFPLTFHQTCWWWFNVAVTRTFWRAKVSGPLPVADGQGAVVVCNHRAPNDPCFVQLTTHRPVHWMVAKEYCESRLYGWFMRVCEVIPVSRGGIDTAATRLAIRLASQGGLVGMFPEGRINTSAELLLPGRPGAALIALKARVPIIPCYVAGTKYVGSELRSIFRCAKVRLIIGRPIDLSPYYDRERTRAVLEEITLTVLSEIARLAGCDDFQPKLAGSSYKPGPDEK
jgi:1-acyl-sn-glycerol-3-phosphate acyltransferase